MHDRKVTLLQPKSVIIISVAVIMVIPRLPSSGCMLKVDLLHVILASSGIN